MTIATDKVVTFHYTLEEEGATQLESSYDGDPVFYLHGHNNLLPAMEEALTGKAPGDKFALTLAPEQAYGHRQEGASQRVPKKHLLTKGKIQPGDLVKVNSEHGPVDARVVKVGLKNVDIDANHPYAGKTLTFVMEVVAVRDATAEEIAHGHVHAHGSCGHG